MVTQQYLYVVTKNVRSEDFEICDVNIVNILVVVPIRVCAIVAQ